MHIRGTIIESGLLESIYTDGFREGTPPPPKKRKKEKRERGGDQSLRLKLSLYLQVCLFPAVVQLLIILIEFLAFNSDILIYLSSYCRKVMVQLN